MANPFFVPGEQRAAKVHDLFAAIAPRYDLINDLQSLGLHRWWKRRVVQLAEAGTATEVLDLCCGTGDLALAFARRGARVTGLDFSEPMLAVARQRSGRARVASPERSVRWMRGDALQLPFPDASFDVVTIAYGLRNLASYERGIAEMGRVLRPGGRALVLDFGKPDWAPWRAVYFTYLRLVVPIFGLLFCGNAAAYRYILESLQHYPAQRGVDLMFRQAGFARTRIHPFLGGMMSINLGAK